MKRKPTDNISLKIMSLAVGIFVWLLVANVDNPIVTKSVTVTDVEVINSSYIEDNGQMILREETQESIRVTLRGERKTLNRITSSDIHAVADLQQAVSLKTDPVMVPITVTCDKLPSENIEVTPNNLSIHIEDKKTQEFVVNVSVGESSPAKGYEVGTKTSNPEKIKITGPTSLINKIDRVNAVVSVENRTEDMDQETELQIIDRNGDKISDTELSYLNVPKVSVMIKLWKVRSNVNILAEYSGEPAAGYEVGSISTLPEVVSVAGDTEALESLAEEGNTISIPAEYVDISGMSSDYEQKINLTELLPDGLKLTSDSVEDIFVMVNILPVGSEIYQIPTKNIEVKNRPDNLQAVFETDSIEVRVQGTGEPEKELTEEMIGAYIDLEGMEEGSYDIPVDISLPEGYELVESVTASVKLSEVINIEENSGENE